jgi:hypothetical protein
MVSVRGKPHGSPDIEKEEPLTVDVNGGAALAPEVVEQLAVFDSVLFTYAFQRQLWTVEEVMRDRLGTPVVVEEVPISVLDDDVVGAVSHLASGV